MPLFDVPSAQRRSSPERRSTPTERMLGRVVDAGLIGVPMLGPWFMGGRHPLGELAIVALAVVVALAWLGQQASAPKGASWTRSPGQWILLAAVAVVAAQLVPWPPALLDFLSPHTRQLLTLWQGDLNLPGNLGHWSQVSMTPDWTRAGLILLLAYGMIFLVAVQRLRDAADVQWMLRWVAVAVTVQAVFGIVQYLTANGKFVWIYQHPFRDTYTRVTGAFINQNHFAHLMALGLGPLMCLVAMQVRHDQRKEQSAFKAERIGTRQIELLGWMLALGIVLFAGLLTFSRGGALAMLLATLVVIGALYSAGLLGWRFVAAVTTLALIIGASLTIHGYRHVANRLDDYAAGSIEELDQGGPRRAIWNADFKALADYGWFGSGVGSHREIYPMYLNDAWEVEFTHAENGYLQVALETGVPGLVLLLGGIALCARWCLRNVNRLADREVYFCGIAVAGALAASVVHSLVDFVWYIPSLMAITALLIACAYRLASAGTATEQSSATRVALSPWQWRVAPAAVALLGVWMIQDRFCAAMAEPHWDYYLSYALKEPVDGEKPAADKSVVSALEEVLYWTPDNAKAHIRLASLLLGRFEQLQLQAANAMPLNQISEAALASQNHFSSPAELDQWLDRAIGVHRNLLKAALWHLHSGLDRCALLGEGYVHLADLCFLEGQGQAERLAYLNQAVAVRPYDGVVLLTAGSAAALRGDVEGMIGYWRPVLHCRLQERLAMVRLLTAAPISVEEVLRCFEPDLSSTRLLFQRYNQLTTPDQLQPLYNYYGQLLNKAIEGTDEEQAAPLWFEMHELYHKLGQPDPAIKCLQRSVVGRPTDFDTRFILGVRLNEQGRFAEAKQQLEWCTQRRPGYAAVKEHLTTSVNGLIDQQTSAASLPGAGRSN